MTNPRAKMRLYLGVLWAAGLWISWLAPSFAQPCSPWVTRVVSVQGTVLAKRANHNEWSRVNLNDEFCAEDMILTEVHSRVGLLLRNQTVLKLDQRTTLVLPQMEEDSTWLNLLKGALHMMSNLRYDLKIKTPFVNAALEGTEFAVRVSENDTRVWVIEGQVLVENPEGQIRLHAGEAALAQVGKAPVPYLKITPRDAVQWALYYPPIIDYRESASRDPDQRRAISLYRSGQIAAAIEALGAVPESSRDSPYYTQRASILLSVGELESAQSDIDQALRLKPDNSGPVALQSIIALTRNDKEQALALAEKAVELEPGSPILRVALSYARQASFDIEGARESIRKALELSPDDPLAWARLSELELSSGELDEALEAAEKAEALDPDISHTQMVLGFARLLQIDIDEARQSFQKAIELDPSAPLPRLGMGLAKIRQGDVEQGTQDIEVAALLDPENALVRSYLGKAYYEEKRGSVASREFEIAKKLDPKDPTPWFYDAIHKQTTNRPVEALHDMQKAIELNDNRAVYRSSLLLDDDLAARSASLGRIYNDLGFQNRGLLEGWKSVNGDPSNYSAHRLLADNYAALPRHEIARVSELLQSQLLQPINLTPIQPHLGDKNLLTLSALGTQRLSFNEFNPLFARNRAVLQASGVLGTNDTYGDEIVQSGLWNRFSYSLGQLHSRTKGFRENNDVGNNVYNAFAQITVSPELSLQTEYRYSNTRHGDLQLKWNLDNFRQFDRRRLVTQSVRLGAHYTPGTNSDLIVSAVYLKAKENQTIEVSTPFSSFLVNPYFQSRGYIGETQYLLKIPNYNINLVAGGGLFNFNQNQSGLQGESNFRTAYIYSYIRYPSTATWTFGLGFDSLDDYIFGRFNILNPKLGLIWNITPDTTFRIAGFRGLARAFIGNQTIEPTQVSGFNQLFDDAVGAQSTRYGLAIDQRIFPSIYCGIEVSRRDLKVPKLAFPVENGDWKEELLRGYINWTPSSEIVLTVQYQFEKFRRSAVFDFLPVTDTHFVPVTLGYFHPEGYIARLTTTYVNQSVQFPNGVQDHSQFGLFDIGIGYRLPQRFGIINLGINNVFNKKFNFQGLSGRNFQQEAAQFVPERTISAQFTLSF